MENCRENAIVLRKGLEKTGRFNIISKDEGIPLVAFSLKDNSLHNEFEVSETLRRFGWIVPAYTMPADLQHVTVLRVVIREDFSRTLADRLVSDIVKVLHELPNAKKVEDNLMINNEKKTEIEVQRAIAEFWKKYVLARKASIC